MTNASQGDIEGSYDKSGVDKAIDNSDICLVCVDRRYVKTDVCTAELEKVGPHGFKSLDDGKINWLLQIVEGGKTAIPCQFEMMEFPPKGAQFEMLKNFNTLPFYLSTNEVSLSSPPLTPFSNVYECP